MIMHQSCGCDHGQEFDDRTRWCATCERTVPAETDPDAAGYAFSGKKCPNCSAVWPEYLEEFFGGFPEDPLYQVIFGVGETRH